MAVLELVTVPDPILSRPTRPVGEDEFGPALETVLSDMAETMYAAPGVGLAGPQIGDGRSIVVLDSGEGPQRGRQLVKMVNPVIVERSKERIEWPETCLSVPGMEVRVTRAKRVRVQWREGDGQARERWFEDYEAVIVQHELDHLVGTVLLDRVSWFRRSRYLKQARREQSAVAAP